jgi:hypothetical protein
MGEVFRWALVIVQALCAIMSISIFAQFLYGRRVGNLLGSIVYLGMAVASFELNSWWPLLAGFALAWLLKLLGMDPDSPR